MEINPRAALQPAPTWNRNDLILVLALTVAGGVLRFVGLNEGLWIDEILTLQKLVDLPVTEIIQSYQSRNNHVLYSLAAHYSVAGFGHSAWALRLPAVLAGIAAIPATYYLARQLSSRNEAFLASAFLVASYHHVWFSQNARGYTGLLLGTVLLSICFIRLLAIERPSVRCVLAYAIIAALTCWVHLTGAFVIAAHGIIWLAVIFPVAGRQRNDPKWAALVALLLGGVFTLLLYMPLLPQLLMTFQPQELSWMTPSVDAVAEGPGRKFAWETSAWVFTQFWDAARNAVPGGWPVILLGLLALVAGTWSYGRQGLMSLAILMVPILASVIALLLFSEIFYPRFVFSMMVFLLILAVRGGYVLARAALPVLSVRQVTAIGLVFALASATMVPAAWRPKQDYAGAAEFISSQRMAGDAVACGPYTFLSLNSYLGMDCQAANTTSELVALEQAHARTWFTYSFSEPFQFRSPDLWHRLDQHYTPVARFPSTVGGGDIVIVLNAGRAPENDRKEN